MQHTSSQTVCFIGGAGHSGSTLLGLILGSHSACFYGGEIKKVVSASEESRAVKRLCRLCGEACPIWQGLGGSAEDIYDRLAQRSGASTIIDSAKNVEWIAAQSARVAQRGQRPVLLFLQRDGRAVINSRLRKYPDQPLEALIRDWMEQIERTEALYEAFEGPKAKVRYEALASEPEEVVRGLCQLLGLPYEAAMLDYYTVEHHPIAANTGTQSLVARAQEIESPLVQLSERNEYYYANHPLGIHLDLRWKEELSPDAESLFDALAGTLNQPLRWDGEATPI